MSVRRIARATALLVGVAAAILPAWTEGPADPFALPAAEPVRTGDPAAFSVETLAPGVDLYRPERRGTSHANSLVVDLARGRLVVDAQPTPGAASDLLAAIRARSSAPIRYLVLTHPHRAAAGGEGAFPAETIRIASRGFRDAVVDPEYDFEADLRPADPGAVPEPGARPQPDLVLFGRTRIEDDGRAVILLPVPHAHSPGDLLVFLPAEGIVAAGDLVFPDRSPWAGSARVSGWLAQLNQMVSLAPRRIVPLRGGAIGVDAVRTERNALQWLTGEVADLLADGEAPEAIPSLVRAQPRLAQHFAVGDAERIDVLIRRVVEEERERRRQNGLE